MRHASSGFILWMTLVIQTLIVLMTLTIARTALMHQQMVTRGWIDGSAQVTTQRLLQRITHQLQTGVEPEGVVLASDWNLRPNDCGLHRGLEAIKAGSLWRPEARPSGDRYAVVRWPMGWCQDPDQSGRAYTVVVQGWRQHQQVVEKRALVLME